MTHRAEQIMAAVQTLVTGLTTSGARVDRGRAAEIPVDDTPALRVALGQDIIVDPWAHDLLDSDLDVHIEAHAYGTATNIETLLNLMREEVNIALMANYTLGLAFVHSIVEVGAGRPGLEGEMAKPAGAMELHYRVRYRRSRTNPGA